MKSSENIKQLLDNMNVSPNPDKDLQMLNSVLQAQANAQPNIWRTISIKPITTYIAAAIMMLAGLYSLTFMDKISFCEYLITEHINRQFQIESK